MSYGMQRRRSSASQPFNIFTGKNFIRLAALISLGVSIWFWRGMLQSMVPGQPWVYNGMGVMYGLIPPALVSIVAPWSPGGQYLQSLQYKTVGYAVIVAVLFWFAYYQWDLTTSWWMTPALSGVTVDAAPIAWKNAVSTILGFAVVPGLIISSVDVTEMAETFRQAYLVKKFKVETAGYLQEIHQRRLRAVKLAAKGWANMTLGEKEELFLIGEQFVENIDGELRTMARRLGDAAGQEFEWEGLGGDGRVGKLLADARDIVLGEEDYEVRDEEDRPVRRLGDMGRRELDQALDGAFSDVRPGRPTHTRTTARLQAPDGPPSSTSRLREAARKQTLSPDAEVYRKRARDHR